MFIQTQTMLPSKKSKKQIVILVVKNKALSTIGLLTYIGQRPRSPFSSPSLTHIPPAKTLSHYTPYTLSSRQTHSLHPPATIPTPTTLLSPLTTF